uniref:TetR/AcrR family transcriptional regulator n=1 Tax=Roseibium sp. TaxID=1936156 RepID=UPI003D09796D
KELELVFSKRYDDIRMTEIAEVANVGRSTLYQHFPDKDSILIANMDWVLKGLRLTADGSEAAEDVAEVLEHVWEHRVQARRLLFGVTGEKLEAALSAVILDEFGQGRRTDIPAVLTASQISAAVFSGIRTWLRGEASCAPDVLAQELCRVSAALRGKT